MHLDDSGTHLKPVLIHDGASDESQSSSPHSREMKSNKPPMSRQKLKSTSTCSDEHVDPPKTDASRSERAMSVCSDGGRSTSSMRSRGSSHTSMHPHPSGPRYDDLGRPMVKDVARLKEDRYRERRTHRPMARMEDYGTTPYRHKTSHLRPDLYRSEHARMRKYESHRAYSKPVDVVPQALAASERWYSTNRLSSSLTNRAPDRVSRHPMLSHSPPSHARALGRFDSFGSSNSSGSYRLTPKHERRPHF